VRPLMRYPVTGTEELEDAFYSEATKRIRARNRAERGDCGICSEYDGLFHARCWFIWLTADRVIRGASDGEQQIEPDEDYPSRLRMFRNYTLTLFDPRWWKLCWDERMNPWPYGQ
jgi:hypothetical protein